LRHQDEIEEQKRKEDGEKYRQRQYLYRQELDGQMAIH